MAITVAFETIQDESAGQQTGGAEQLLPGGGIEDNLGHDTTLVGAPTVVADAASAYGASLGVAKSPSGTIDVDPNTTALGFTLAGGAALPLDGSGSTAAPSGLSTTAGLAIYLYAEAGNDNVVIGRDTDGNVAFVIVLAETVVDGVITGADFWILQNQAIDHGTGGTGAAHDNLVDLTDRLFVTSTASTELLFDEFDGVSGQNQWLGFAPTNTTNGNYYILLSGLEPTGTGDFDGDDTAEAHTVNTSNALTEDAIGSNSQSVKVGDGVRFEIVSNLDTTADTKNIDTTSYDTHLPLTSAGFKIVQTGANASNPVDVVVSVYTTGDEEDGAAFNDGIADDADDLATLGMVQVFRGTSTTPLVQSTGSFAEQTGGGVEILAFSDGIVRINNLLQGDRVVVSSASGTTFNRVLVVNDTNEAAANDTFDIGRFTATTASSSTETTEVGSFLNFADDGPRLVLAATTGAEIRMDESPADGDEGSGTLASVTAAAALLFSATTSAGGTDGLDSAATVYALASTNAASGLIDSQTNEAVTLAKVGDDIVGSNASGDEVLRVSIDASTGLVTAVLSRAVDHADGTDPDEQDTPATLAAGSVLVEQTIYDTEGDSATASVDISPAFMIEDDGPSIGTNGVISNLTVPFAIGSGGPVDMLVNGGSDGVGSLAVATFTNATGYVGEKSADGTIVTYYVDDGDVAGVKDAGDTTPAFRLTLDASTGSYSFDVLINTPFVREALNFEAIRAGGPLEIISPPAGTSGATVSFDGLLFGTATTVTDPRLAAYNPGLTTDRDDANPDSEGFGIKDGQASQFNHNEGFKATYNDPATAGADEFAGLVFSIEAIGSTKEVTIEAWIEQDDTIVSLGSIQLTNLPSGNNEVVFDLLDPSVPGSLLAGLADPTFDALYVRTSFVGAAANKGVRLLDFEVVTPGEIDDLRFDFTATVADGDSVPDTATGSFSVGVDGNGSGVFGV